MASKDTYCGVLAFRSVSFSSSALFSTSASWSLLFCSFSFSRRQKAHISRSARSAGSTPSNQTGAGQEQPRLAKPCFGRGARCCGCAGAPAICRRPAEAVVVSTAATETLLTRGFVNNLTTHMDMVVLRRHVNGDTPVSVSDAMVNKAPASLKRICHS